MGNNKLKLIHDNIESTYNQLYISKNSEDFPYLAYLSKNETTNEVTEVSVLGKSSDLKLVHCLELSKILKRFISLGTKFITNSKSLYYLIPSDSIPITPSESSPFIPSIPNTITEQDRIDPNYFVEGKTDEEYGLDPDYFTSTMMRVKTSSTIRWNDTSNIEEVLENKIDLIRKNININPEEPVPHTLTIDYSKESRDKGIGKKAEEVYTNTVSLDIINQTCYTDTLDFNSIITRIKEDDISGLAEISISYSKNDNKMYQFVFFLKIFEYDINDNLVIEDVVIEKTNITIEYINGVLRVFPKDLNEIKECIISNCFITYGKLL